MNENNVPRQRRNTPQKYHTTTSSMILKRLNAEEYLQRQYAVR